MAYLDLADSFAIETAEMTAEPLAALPRRRNTANGAQPKFALIEAEARFLCLLRSASDGVVLSRLPGGKGTEPTRNNERQAPLLLGPRLFRFNLRTGKAGLSLFRVYPSRRRSQK